MNVIKPFLMFAFAAFLGLVPLLLAVWATGCSGTSDATEKNLEISGRYGAQLQLCATMFGKDEVVKAANCTCETAKNFNRECPGYALDALQKADAGK